MDIDDEIERIRRLGLKPGLTDAMQFSRELQRLPCVDDIGRQIREMSVGEKLAGADDISRKIREIGAAEKFAGVGNLKHEIGNVLGALRYETDLTRKFQSIGIEPRGSALAGIASAVEAGRRLSGFSDLVVPRPEDLAAAFKKLEISGLGAAAESVGLASIRDEISGFLKPWAMEDSLLASARSMAEHVGIEKLLAMHDPFASRVSEILRSDFGDWRSAMSWDNVDLTDPTERFDFYREQGFDPSLFIAPPPARRREDEQEGSEEPKEITPAPRSESLATKFISVSDKKGFERNGVAYAMLNKLEVQLRRFIHRAMTDAFTDENWIKSQVDPKRVDEWRRAQETARKCRRPVGPLLDYCDFTDYIHIIGRRDNWPRAFERIFVRKESITESLQRLYPLRLATMHSHVNWISAQEIYLMDIELVRIYSAINAAYPGDDDTVH